MCYMFFIHIHVSPQWDCIVDMWGQECWFIKGGYIKGGHCPLKETWHSLRSIFFYFLCMKWFTGAFRIIDQNFNVRGQDTSEINCQEIIVM